MLKSTERSMDHPSTPCHGKHNYFNQINNMEKICFNEELFHQQFTMLEFLHKVQSLYKFEF